MAKIIDIQKIGTKEKNEVLENILRLICKNPDGKLDEVIIYDSTKFEKLFREMVYEKKIRLDEDDRKALEAVFLTGRLGKGKDAGLRRRNLHWVKRTILNKPGQRCVYSPSILSQGAIGEERYAINKIFKQIGEQFSKRKELKPEDAKVLMGKLKELKSIIDEIDEIEIISDREGQGQGEDR